MAWIALRWGPALGALLVDREDDRVGGRIDIEAVVEDAAQGYLAEWNGRALGSIGSLGAFGFHQSKNVVSGEGGVLVINDPAFVQGRISYARKGTNRTAFLRGEVDRCEWLDMGASLSAERSGGWRAARATRGRRSDNRGQAKLVALLS